MNDYGRIDLLWLDGGWVRPRETVNEEVRSWGAAIPAWSQDINMPGIALMARQAQPGLLIVDRTVHGPYENYQTPEQRIPDNKLDVPWESCLTLGNAWGFVPNDTYKSSAEVIHRLIEITAKGGNLLLGIGPKADGTLPAEAEKKMAEIGQWLQQNGKAIYNTRTAGEYKDGSVYFTQSKDGQTLYALACTNGDQVVPASVEWSGNVPAKGTKMKLLQDGTTVKWKAEGNKVKVFIPLSLQKKNMRLPALAFAYYAG